jgi:putative addiction module killer protein
MVELRKTLRFEQWLDDLKDLMGRARIQARLKRLAQGHRGDCKPVGAGVLELRFQFGPGYRVYFTQRGETLVSSSLEAIKAHKPVTLHWQLIWRKNCEGAHHG